MTKQQLKEKYNQWNVEMGNNSTEANKIIFNKMQELAKENEIPAYCSMDYLLKLLIPTKDCNKAIELYGKYNENIGKQKALKELAISTENFKI